MATQTSSEYTRVQPRARHVGTNRMQASIVETATMSASDELWLFPIPPQCFVTGGAIKGSVPGGVSGQAIIKLGTKESDNAFGTYTVSGGAVLSARLSIVAPVTVSSSDDLLPYQRAVIATINSAPSSASTSLSLYVLLEYTMPGNLP